MFIQEKTSQLSSKIIEDRDKVTLIDQFLEETNIWHNLCRKGVLDLNFVEEIPFDKTHKYYPYEKLTFIFLLYYDFKGQTLLDIHTSFYNSIPLFKKLTKEQQIMKDKEGIMDTAEIRTCLMCIFNGIGKDQASWNHLKECYKSFCLKTELTNSLSNDTPKKKQIKI